MPPTRMNRRRPPPPTRGVTCALLGVQHPHSAALLATLDHLPEVCRIHVWEEAPGGAARAGLARSRKVATVSAELDRVLGLPDVAFALVCVRNDEAVALGRRVVAAGKHLLIDKPVSVSAAEVRKLRREVERAGRLASVLFVRRTHPVVMEARRLARSDGFGRILSHEVRFLATQPRFRSPESWLFQRRHSGGGVLSWLGCHYIDLLHHVSGDDIVSVTACVARRSAEPIDVEDQAALALSFRSGAIGTLHVGYTLAHHGGGYLNPTGNDGYYACNAKRGRLVWPVMARPRLHVEGPGPGDRRERGFRLRATNSYAGAPGLDFIRQFIAAIDRHADLPATLRDAERSAAVIEAAYASARTGRRVSVAPIVTDGPGGKAVEGRAVALRWTPRPPLRQTSSERASARHVAPKKQEQEDA